MSVFMVGKKDEHEEREQFLDSFSKCLLYLALEAKSAGLEKTSERLLEISNLSQEEIKNQS